MIAFCSDGTATTPNSLPHAETPWKRSVLKPFLSNIVETEKHIFNPTRNHTNLFFQTILETWSNAMQVHTMIHSQRSWTIQKRTDQRKKGAPQSIKSLHTSVYKNTSQEIINHVLFLSFSSRFIFIFFSSSTQSRWDACRLCHVSTESMAFRSQLCP